MVTLQRRWRRTNELVDLYVLNCKHKKRKQFGCRDAYCIPPQHHYSIRMGVLYSSLLTYRSPVGIQLRCSGSGWNPSTAPPQTFIIIVTLGAKSGPTGPQTFPRRASPGERGRKWGSDGQKPAWVSNCRSLLGKAPSMDIGVTLGVSAP